MCSHYQAVRDLERYRRAFHVYPPVDPEKSDVWPGYAASFIRLPKEVDSGDEAVPAREAAGGQFGLIPNWATDTTIARRTFNCRSETAASKPSFRDAWKRGQRCIIPADAIYEPDWRSGKAVPTRISRKDGEPMGIAGLWSWWKSPKGDVIHSFTLLTVNAAEHALMNQFHKPADEKRMVVILPTGAYADWLTAPVAQGMDFMRPYPADGLEAAAAPTLR